MPRSPGSGSAGPCGRRPSIRARTRFEISPDTLVVATVPDGPLLIAYGSPGAATERQEDRFLVGLLGAALAIGSAMVFAVMLDGGFGP